MANQDAHVFRRQRDVKRQKINEIKAERGCYKCGERDPACLQFHHRDPTGKFKSVAQLLCGGWGWSSVMYEVEKCDVLCANCHLKMHQEEYDEIRLSYRTTRTRPYVRNKPSPPVQEKQSTIKKKQSTRR